MTSFTGIFSIECVAQDPGVPTDFTATVMSKTRIDLVWMKGENADQTYIERNMSLSWIRGEGTSIYNDTGTSFQDDGLSENSHYYYQGWSWNQTTYSFSTTSTVADNTTFANQQPIFGSSSPSNGSTNTPLSLIWSIPINDPDGDAFSWTIECSSGQTNSAADATNGTKSLSLSGLAYSTTYTVWVNATDSGGSGQYTRRWYTFTTKTSLPPIFGSPNPSNGSTNNPLSFSWSIPINDPEGDTFSWTIQCSNGQSNSGTGATNGTKTLAISGLAFLTTYEVWVNATDSFGSGLYTRSSYTFTTMPSNSPPVFGSPSPANGSTGNLLSFSWSIPMNDMEGDSFNWAIQCSNGQSANANGASNGTKTLTISNLAYLKTYKVWVNATDPTGSGNYTRKNYSFTTRSTNPSPPPVPPEPSNKNPIADMSAGEPYHEFVNSEITFNGSKSYDPDGNITKWFWVFSDNTNGNGKTIRHSYSKAGTYNVSLTVTDNQGATNTDTTKCMISQVNNRPPTKPFITGPINGTKNTIYTYTAVSTDADNNTLQYTFDWGGLISTHQLSGFLPNGSGFTQNHSWEAAGRYDVMVTVTDNQTESSSKITVYIDAKPTGDIGYLLDNNSDGTYDAFYSDISKQITAVQKMDGNYNINSDGKDGWDYTFDTIKGLILYQEPKQEPKIPGFELIIVIGAIALVMLWKRKRIAHD